MNKKRAAFISLMLLSLGATWVVMRFTIMNSAWVVGKKYPEATLYLVRLDSPHTYVWGELGELFGIPVTTPDRYLNVQIDRFNGNLSLDDFTEVSELHISNSRIADISAYHRKPGFLSCPTFTNCDFSALPDSQRRLLQPYAPNPEHPELYPDTLWIPFESNVLAGNGQRPLLDR